MRWALVLSRVGHGPQFIVSGRASGDGRDVAHADAGDGTDAAAGRPVFFGVDQSAVQERDAGVLRLRVPPPRVAGVLRCGPQDADAYPVGRKRHRGNPFALQTPHYTAVVVDKATGVEWVVDLWPKNYAEAPDVMPVERWLKEDCRWPRGTGPCVAAAAFSM